MFHIIPQVQVGIPDAGIGLGNAGNTAEGKQDQRIDGYPVAKDGQASGDLQNRCDHWIK